MLLQLASREGRRLGIGEALWWREVAEGAAMRSAAVMISTSTTTSTSTGRGALDFSFSSSSRARSSSSSGVSSSSSSLSMGRQEEEKARGDRLATEAGLGVARSRLNSFVDDDACGRHHRRFFHGSSSSSSDRGDDEQPQTQPTATATSIADALRLPRNSLTKLDLSGGSADLRCVNLLCERVGCSCICRLSLALSKVAERQGGSLEELSLARNGIDELPGAVWLLGGGEGGEGGGGDSESPTSSQPSFRALRRIDLSGNQGLKRVCGMVGRGRKPAEAMPALREVVVDRGVLVEEGDERGRGPVEIEVVEI